MLVSVRRVQAGLQFSEHGRIEAGRKNASAFRLRFSQILGEPSAAIEPSDGALDDPAFGQDLKSADSIGAFDYFDVEMRQNFCKRFRKLRSLISAVGRASSKGKHPEQGRHDENASIAILNVSRIERLRGAAEKLMCRQKCAASCPLISLARIVPVRINARPPFFRAFHALAVDDGGGRIGSITLRFFATLLIKRVGGSVPMCRHRSTDRSSRRPSSSAAGLSGSRATDSRSRGCT